MQNTTINGRTPEEIKLGLVHCLTAREYRNCLVCPYGTPRKRGILPCDCEVRQDILALIDQLLEDKKQLERERDAAVRDMRDATLCGCHVCKHYYRPDVNVRIYACRKFGEFGKFDYIKDDGSMFCGAFEWRGVEVVN